MHGVPRVRSAMCPGTVLVRGHGNVSLVNAEWSTPGLETGTVKVIEGGSVVPHVGGRTYFADDCTDGAYNHSHYASMKLLDRTFRYTVDLSLAGCGCNAALYLAPLQRNSFQSECKDYFCDARKSCGIACTEIDIQEANVFGWRTSAHAWDDSTGVGIGIGGNTTTWTKAEYGPGAACVDTLRPFQVAASFPTDFGGKLRAVVVELSQLGLGGRSCNLTAEVASYAVRGRDGMAELSEVLAGGVTPIISYWSSDEMLWLDGEGSSNLTDCKEDIAANCAPLVMFYSFSVEDYEAPKRGCERCPVGSCDRLTPTGDCHWFDAAYLGSSYHCRVEACSEVPQGRHFSTCWSREGKHFYSIVDRGQPCQADAADRERPCGAAGDAGPPCEASLPPIEVAARPPGTPEPEADEQEPDDGYILNQTLHVIDLLMMAEARDPGGLPRGGAGPQRMVAVPVACLVGALVATLSAAVALRRAGGESMGCKHTRLAVVSPTAREDALKEMI